MTTATVAILEEAYEDNPQSATLIKGLLGLGNKFDPRKAETWLTKEKNDNLNHYLGKGTRPWEIVNVTAKLDPKQPWIGVEYETGYATLDQYQKVINHVWANHPLTAIDREGCGNYPVEITFAPVNLELFMSKNYHMDTLLKFQKENKCPHSTHHRDDNIGTHVNVSTPAYRALARDKAAQVTRFLYAILQMSNENFVKVFGRTPYGGWNAMSDARGNQWIEGKVFNSTGSLTTWAKYKQVMSRISELVEHFSRLKAADKLPVEFRTTDGVALLQDTDQNWVKWQRAENVDALVYKNIHEFLLGEVELNKLKTEYKPFRRNGNALAIKR